MFNLKQKRKTICSAILVGTMMLSLVGCGKKEPPASINTPDEPLTTEEIGPDTEEPSVDTLADPNSPEAIAEQERFDTYVMDSFRDAISSDSISIHYYLCHPENYSIDASVATLGDAYCLTDEEVEAERAETTAEDDDFYSINYDLLTASQKFDYDVYKRVIDANNTYYDLYFLQEPFAYTSGLHSNMPINYSEYTFRSAEDVPMYLELLDQLPDYIDNAIEFEKVRIEKGYFMNRHNANEVIRQCSEFIADPESNLLLETFNAKIDALTDLDTNLAEEYKQQNYDIVKNHIIPAYERIINFFKDNKSACKNDFGICYLDGGKEYYEYLLANQTGTDRTPEEIIALYDSYMDEYMGELSSVAMLHYTEYMSFIENYDTLYGDIDPDETLRFFEDTFKDRFPEMPRFEYTISPVHESLKNIVSPAFYMLCPVDNTSENTIRLNIESDGAGDLWSTLAHEGIPGHMYQRNYFLQTNPAPLRAVLNHMGYTEGWATYVEFISYEYYDGYAEPVYADLARLNTQISLVLQARIDIGVNYEGWKTADVENYLTTSGFDASVAEDVINYVAAEPANYQAYVLGWLEFEELRKSASTQLGDKFDEKEFHKTLLDAGPCAFPQLEERVNAYIKENK